MLPALLQRCVWLVAVLAAVLLPACQKDSANPAFNPSISMSITPGVTEVWLSIRTIGAETTHFITLWRDGRQISRFDARGDTVVVDEGLNNAESHRYQAFLVSKSRELADTGVLTVITLDTTSHHFAWSVTLFPDSVSGSLYDVVMPDPNHAWAVGTIRTPTAGVRDSLGRLIPAYNALEWDGSQWNFRYLPTGRYDGRLDSTALRTAWALSSTDVWTFANYGSYSRWNGTQWEPGYLSGAGGIQRMWGRSTREIYLVGPHSIFLRYDGRKVERLVLGEDVDLAGIFGGVNPATGEIEFLTGGGNYLLILRAGRFRQLNPPTSIASMWLVAGLKYFVGGVGVYMTADLSSRWRWQYTRNLNYVLALRGQNLNDVLAAGRPGAIAHFNGKNWESFSLPELAGGNARFNSLVYENNTALLVGSAFNNHLVIVRGEKLAD